jgi:glycosyltransferase involved in cell wall biosynthesis
MSIRISAIICTHNRAAYLIKAIQSLVSQTLPKEQYEIIVVDNGSIDETKAIVEGFENFGNQRYIYEPILGLSQARNTGWRNAKGQYVAFLDDDAIACPEWLERIIDAFETVEPRPGSVGGKITLIWEAERPAWLSRHLEGTLGYLDWGNSPMFLSEGYQWLGGGNVAYPREVLKEVGGFSTSLQRKAGDLMSNAEVLLKRYLEGQGLGNYYDPGICVQHHVVAERLVKRWFYRRYYWQGISSTIMKYLESHQHGISFHYLRLAFLNALGFVRQPVNLLAIVIPASSAGQVVKKCRSYTLAGQIWAQVRIGLGLVGQ